MAKKTDYTVVRVPDSDWNNIMETVTLDGSYSDEIKDEVWTAIENMESFSYPWMIVKIINEKISAKIFSNKDSAEKYVANSKKKSKTNVQYYYIKATYQSR